jgi:hypothetical protein
MRHLSPEELVDLAEGTLQDALHVRSCEVCRRRLADLRSVMSAVGSVEAPEPSPLFWDHLSARVRDAIASEPASRTPILGAWPWISKRAVWAGALAVGVLVAAVVTRLERAPTPDQPAAGSTTAGVELRGSFGLPDDDPSFALVADLVTELDWEVAHEAGLITDAGDDEGILTQLSEGERQALHELLKAELPRSGA